MTYIKACISIIASLCFFLCTSALSAANKTIWQGESGGLNIHWTNANITATTSFGRLLFSAQELAEKNFEADFLVDNSLKKKNECEYKSSFSLLSVVGSIANIKNVEYIRCQNMPHSTVETEFQAIDLTNEQVVKLTNFFAESDILKALLADSLIKKALTESDLKTSPTSLKALSEALEWSELSFKNCKYRLPENFLSQFAFHHLSRSKVAIRMHLFPIAAACQSKNIQIDFFLPIPTSLKVALNRARMETAGFLMERYQKIARKKTTSISFSTANYSPRTRKKTLPDIASKYPLKTEPTVKLNTITVQVGDTLYTVAKRYKLEVDDIIIWNHLLPPYNLLIGQKLVLNPPSAPSPSPDEKLDNSDYHTVVAGETLYGIARRYNQSFKKIIAWNNLQAPYIILIGQKLRVSKPSKRITRRQKNTFDNKPRIYNKPIITTASGVRMRSSIEGSSSLIETLPIGTVAKQIARSQWRQKIGNLRDYWYKVELKDGKQGWIFGGLFMSFNPKPKQRAQIYLKISQTRLQKKLSLPDQIDLTDFLARAKKEVLSPPDIAAKLALSHLLSLQKSLEQLDVEKQNQEPYHTWLHKQNENNLIVYNEIGASWLVNSKAFRALHDKYYPLPVTDDIDWAAANNPVGGECEGFLECELYRMNKTTLIYLKYHPTGKHVEEALDKILEFLGYHRKRSDITIGEKMDLPRLFAVLSATVERTNNRKTYRTLRNIDRLKRLVK